MKTNSNLSLKRPALLTLATALVLGTVIDRADAIESPGGGASLPPAVQTQFTVNQAAVPALPVPGKTQQLISPDQVPEGLAKSDWSSIRAAYEAGRHAFQPTATGWQARNPGQQWTTTFDQRGFLAQPADGAWTWGLELRSYGFGESQRTIGGTPEVQAVGQRLSYQWDTNLQEWFVNDQRGLEHGFTVSQRPAVPLNTQPSTLSFLLATRGTLSPSISADAKGVLFQDAHGATVLNYTGLKVWDADGKVLTAHFEAVGQNRVRLLVDERAARYPIIIDPIAQQAYLKASNTGAVDLFGNSVAVAGDTVVVGAARETSNATGVNGDQSDNSLAKSGAAYVFVRNGTNWSQQAYLKASNTGAGDEFGISVAVSGDTVVVGARHEASNATGVNGDQSDNSVVSAGAAYVFVRNGTSWSQQAYLKASNPVLGDTFGHSVAVSGDTVVVGASSENINGTGVNGNQIGDLAENSGAAYVFVRNGTGWNQQAYLKSSNSEENDLFGGSVAVSGDTVVVGATGEASNATGVNGDQSDNSAGNSGAVYVFVRNGASWSQQTYLKASNTEASDSFGVSVAVSGDTVVVGAVWEASNATGVNGDQSDNSAEFSGAVYVFVRNGASWSQQAYLKASNTGVRDTFGVSVAVSGDTVVVGADLEASNAKGINGNQNNSANRSGAAYVFVRSGTSWSQQAFLKASNTGVGDFFGVSVAVSGDTVVVGAMLETSNATGVNGDQNDNSVSASGAVYVFTGLGISVDVSSGRFSNLVYSPGTGFHFTFSDATPGHPYRIETSSSLAADSWSDLTNFIYAGPIDLTDPSAQTNAKHYYRAVTP